MTAGYVDRATFMDQVKVGDIIHVDRFEGPNLTRVWESWVVTGVRTEETYNSFANAQQTLIILVGVTDDGQPRHHMSAGWVPVIVREPIREAAP